MKRNDNERKNIFENDWLAVSASGKPVKHKVGLRVGTIIYMLISLAIIVAFSGFSTYLIIRGIAAKFNVEDSTEFGNDKSIILIQTIWTIVIVIAKAIGDTNFRRFLVMIFNTSYFGHPKKHLASSKLSQQTSMICNCEPEVSLMSKNGKTRIYRKTKEGFLGGMVASALLLSLDVLISALTSGIISSNNLKGLGLIAWVAAGLILSLISFGGYKLHQKGGQLVYSDLRDNTKENSRKVLIEF